MTVKRFQRDLRALEVVLTKLGDISEEGGIEEMDPETQRRIRDQIVCACRGVEYAGDLIRSWESGIPADRASGLDGE